MGTRITISEGNFGKSSKRIFEYIILKNYKIYKKKHIKTSPKMLKQFSRSFSKITSRTHLITLSNFRTRTTDFFSMILKIAFVILSVNFLLRIPSWIPAAFFTREEFIRKFRQEIPPGILSEIPQKVVPVCLEIFVQEFLLKYQRQFHL